MKISNRLSFKFLDPWRCRVAQIIKEREQRRTPPGTRVKASLNAISKDEPEKCPCYTKPRRLTARVTQAIFMWIFPVKVHVNGKKTVVHAFYRSDSGVTLCTQRVINKLNLNG